MLAWRVVRSVLGSLDTSEIRAARRRFELELEDLVNDNNAVKCVDATVTDLTFSIAGSTTLFEIDGKKAKRSTPGRR
jgi:hypothetical protein